MLFGHVPPPPIFFAQNVHLDPLFDLVQLGGFVGLHRLRNRGLKFAIFPLVSFSDGDNWIWYFKQKFFFDEKKILLWLWAPVESTKIFVSSKTNFCLKYQIQLSPSLKEIKGKIANFSRSLCNPTNPPSWSRSNNGSRWTFCAKKNRGGDMSKKHKVL